MADMVSIALVATDQVSGPARAAAGALGTIEAAAGRGVGVLGSLAATAAKTAVALGALGAGVAAAGLTAGINAARGFEQQMSAVAAVVDKAQLAAVGGSKALSDLALQLGKDTSFSAREAAQGLEELVKAGVSVTDIMGGGARAALDLAAAGAVSVRDAAEIASNAMNVFNLSGSQMAHVADVIAGAANASAIDVNDFKFSLAASGAAANLAGVSFEDLATAIALMGNSGIKGSDAGTSLKVMLTNLQPSTKAQAKEFQRLGLITEDGANAFFTAEGKAKSLAEVAGVLQTAMAGMTAQQKLASLELLFGTDALRAAAILTDAGADGFRELASAIGAVRATDVANERLDNLAGSLEKLKGSLETAAIAAGLKFTPSLKRLVDLATDGVNRATPTIERFAEVAAAGFDRLVTRAQAAGPALGAVGFAALAFGQRLIDLARGAMPQLAAAFEQVRGLLGGASGAVGGGLANAFATLQGAVTPLIPVVEAVGRSVVENLVTNFRFLTDQVLPPVVSIVQQTGQLLLSTLVPAAQQTGAVMRGILGESLGWLAATVWPPLLSVVQQTSDLFTREILPTLPGVAAALRTTLGETVQWLASEVWPRLTAAAGAAWRFISGTIAPAIPELARSLRSVLGGALEWIGTTGWPLLERGAQAVVTAFEGIRGRVGPIVEQALNGDIAGAIRNLGSAFSEVAGLAAGWIGEQVARIDWASVWGRAVNVVGGMAAWFGALAGQLATWIGEQVAAVDWASVWNRAVDAVGAMVTWFADLGARLLTWVGDQVAAVDWSAVWARAVEVVAGMAQWFTTVASVFATWLGEQVGRIQWPSVWSNVTGMAEAMQAAFEREAAKLDWKAITQANKDMARQLAEGINEMIRAVDWTVVGQELAANMFREGGGVEQAMRAGWKLLRAPLVLIEPLVEFIKTADWGAVAQAFADVVAGFIEEGFRRAWATIRPLLPSWLDPLPRPPGGAMPFPVAPGSGLAPSTPGRSSAGGNVMSEPIDNSSRSSFVRTAYPYALAAAGGDPNLAEMMLAAAISENGDVGQGGGFIGNNFFGIKGSGPAGSFDADTWEWENGQRVPQRATFAAYSTPQEGLGGFLQFLQQNPRYSDALQQFQQTGDVDALFAGINRAGYATDPAWASTITNIRQNQVAPIASTLRATAPQAGLPSVRALNQFELGMPWADAQAACGPAALMTFWAATGRTPDPEEALQLARQSGWDRAGGMNGVGNFMDMLGRAGVSAALDATPTEAEIQASLAAGRPVAISTAGHYFTATGYDPLTGQYNVGGSGEALTGGSALMTMQEIIALTGPLNGAITLLDQVAPAALGAAAGVAPLGQGMAGLTAQTIDTSGAVGQVSEAIGLMAEGVGPATESVAANFDLMREGTLTSVTDMGTGLLTTMQDAAGNTVATITDMAGQVVSQSATLATGVTLSMTDMGVETQQVVDEMAGTITTTMADLAGNSVTTVTDMQGNVISQFATMQAEAGSSVADLATAVTDSATTMADDMLRTITDMGAGASEAMGELASSAEEEFGRVVEEAGRVPGAADEVNAAFDDLQAPDVGDIVDAFGEIADAAEDAKEAAEEAADALDDVGDGGGGDDDDDGDRDRWWESARATGGPVLAGAAYLVGERGRELFVPSQSGYVVDAGRTAALLAGAGASAAGSGRTETIRFVLQTPEGRTLEEWYVRGKELAAIRGRDR